VGGDHGVALAVHQDLETAYVAGVDVIFALEGDLGRLGVGALAQPDT
jgi:5,10-methylenetetrahydrofolate reductase